MDLLAHRDSNYLSAAKLFTLVDRGEIVIFSSPIIFANLHYLLRKLISNSVALKSLRKLKTVIRILSVDEKIIEQSLSSDFTDFEGAIRYFAAVNNRLTIIITRN